MSSIIKTPEMFSLSRRKALFTAILLSLGLAHIAWAGDWNLKDKDGAHYSLSGLGGKWVLVNFWAPWCPPCLEEMSDLNVLQQRHKDLQVIGVAVMYGSRKEVMDVVHKKSISYPIVFGNEDTAGDFGGLDGTPTSFLYSPTGKLIEHFEGPVNPADVEHRIH